MAIWNLFANKIFLAGIIAWCLAQFLKFVIEGVKTGKFNAKMLVFPGKMPSAHTSTIVAVTASVYLLEGFSNLFMLSLFVAFVVMYDTVTSRKQVGIITQALNATLRKKIRYFEGHTVPQMVVGAIIGIAIACLVKWI